MKYTLNHNFTNIGQHTFYVYTNDNNLNPVTMDDIGMSDTLMMELQFRLSQEFNQFLLDNNLIQK